MREPEMISFCSYSELRQQLVAMTAERDAAIQRAEESEAKLQSSLVITPERVVKNDDWGKVKRIMWKPGPLESEEVNIIVRCLEDSMYEEVTLAAVIRKQKAELVALRRVVADVIERMDRARRILTNGAPSQLCNWGMLDTSDIRQVLDAAAADKAKGESNA